MRTLCAQLAACASKLAPPWSPARAQPVRTYIIKVTDATGCLTRSLPPPVPPSGEAASCVHRAALLPPLEHGQLPAAVSMRLPFLRAAALLLCVVAAAARPDIDWRGAGKDKCGALSQATGRSLSPVAPGSRRCVALIPIGMPRPCLLTMSRRACPLLSRVYDVILFNGEADMMEIRLYSTAREVDFFVVVESASTFTHVPRRPVFEDNKDRFAALDERQLRGCRPQ